jgi:protoheme IX farnesyltransferase
VAPETPIEVARRCKTPDSSMRLYWKLAKGKLTTWVAISAMPGYFLALPAGIDPLLLSTLAVGTFLTSSSAQTMNQIIEVSRDARMQRTAQRPLPSGQLAVDDAVRFALASGVGGLGLLSVGANPATAAVAGVTMLTYAAMYTPLKIRSPYNTHIGAISGSLPTLMGFTAALGGAGLAASPWAAHAAWIFAMQTIWQMPHFYALAWIYRADYLRGGYIMFPLRDDTGLATAAMCKPYLVALCAMPWAASACGLASWMLPVGASVPSAFWWLSLRAFEKKPTPARCRRFFLNSLSYLLAMLGLFTCYAHVEVATNARESKQIEGVAVDADGSTSGDSSCSEREEASHAQHAENVGQMAQPQLLGPAWRAAVHAGLAELCPHEQMRYWFFGTNRDACPFSGSRSP